MRFNKYYVSGLEDKENSVIFIRLMSAICDSFSLIYYSHGGVSIPSPSTFFMKFLLKKHIVNSTYVTRWPGTEVIDNGRDRYLMITYSTGTNYLRELEIPTTVYNWDYPKYPMDLCFYKDGVVRFETTAHEMRSVLYLPEDGGFPTVDDIESFGIRLEPDGSILEEHMYKLPVSQQGIDRMISD